MLCSEELRVEFVLNQASLRLPTQRLDLSVGTINVTVAGADTLQLCIFSIGRYNTGSKAATIFFDSFETV